MAENVAQSVEVPVPLELFGSLVTEMSPQDLPEGISPDNQDIVFLPGAVGSRPGLHRWLSTLPAGTTVSYEKTFITPAGLSLNLILTSDGAFSVQNLSTGVVTRLANVTPGSYATSCTAFGKELIAFHNGKHGTDFPRTYDGNYFDRATCCGPGSPPVVQSLVIPATQMTAAPTVNVSLASIETINPASSPFTGGYTGILITANAAFTPPPTIQLNGNSNPVFNNVTLTVQTVLSPTEIICAFVSSSFEIGYNGTLSSGIAGNIVSRVNNTVTCYTAEPHLLQVGYQVQITNVAPLLLPEATSIVIDNELLPGIATITTPTPHGLLPNNYVVIQDVESVTIGGAITSATGNGEVVTIQTSEASNLQVGSLVTVTGTSTGSDGSWEVYSVTSPTEFSYLVPGANYATGTVISSSGLIQLVWPLGPDTTTAQDTFQVISCPTPTTFQVNINYQDGNWGTLYSGGSSITFSWDGTFFVTAILSPTSFQYQQYGPNGSVTASSTQAPQSYTQQAASPVNISYNPAQYAVSGNELRTAGGVAGGVVTDYIIATNFGFNVPTTATIEGIQTSLNWLGQYAGTGELTAVALYYQGSIIGTVKTPNTENTASATSNYQGNSSDLWGYALTPTIINDPSFGVGFQVTTATVSGSTRSFFNTFSITVNLVNAGTVTPSGQVAPGQRQCVVLFQTRTGFITAPSPYVTLETNGNQYLSVSNVPIGGPEVVARILAFTGANGGNYFYIPVPALSTGLTVSTSTVINDNVTTSAIFDFSDLTLFAAEAIDIPGSDFFNMATLGRCLGVNSYGSRAAWYGMHNYLTNLLNLGFEGGYQLSLYNPTGWTSGEETGGVLGGILNSTYVDYGFCWAITGNASSTVMSGLITQPAATDQLGISIFQPMTQYSVGLKAAIVVNGGTTGNIILDLYSPSLGSALANAELPINILTATQTFYDIEFSASLPLTIPSDLQLRLYTLAENSGTTVTVDEIEIYPTDNPYNNGFLFSYVLEPEQVDLITGALIQGDDDFPVQCSFIDHDNFHFLTQAALYETQQVAGSEPSGWNIRQVSTNCGTSSPMSCSTGENFSLWVTSPSSTPATGRGLYIYNGSGVYKLSQEIQPDFDSITTGCENAIWTGIDLITRRIYVGLPQNGSVTPNVLYVLDFREMDTAQQLISNAPIHISLTGKMVCSDLARKWTRWNVSANYGTQMNTQYGAQFSICGGNGEALGSGVGFNTLYYFDPTYLIDDDYGQISPYYTTYFFINHQDEQQFQVGLHRKLYKRYYIYIQGTGLLQLTPYGDTLTNPLVIPPNLPLSTNQTYDLGDGLNAIADRCAFKIASIPIEGQTDNSFVLNKLIITLCQEPIAPLRFGAV